MQISNQITSQQQPAQQQVPVRKGEIYRATIKERKGDNQAVLTIRGREITATFEGKIPEGDRVMVQVTDPKGETIQVRAVTEETKGTPPLQGQRQGQAQTVLQSMGMRQPSSELIQAVQILIDKGISLTNEGIRELQRFMNEGTASERLNTVQALANKSLELTATHLRSIHEALHGRPINEVLQDLARELNRDFQIQPRDRSQTDNRVSRVPGEPLHDRIIMLLQKEGLPTEVRQQLERLLQQLPKIGEEGRIQLSQALEKLEQRQSGGMTPIGPTIRDIFQKAQQQIQREGNFEKALQSVQSTLSQLPSFSAVTPVVEASLAEALQLKEQGRELAARQNVGNLLMQLENQMVAKDASLANQGQVYQGNEQFQTSVELGSKSIAVTTVTQKLAELTESFKLFQRDVTRSLDQIHRLMEQFRSQANAQTKPLLETTINKLDHAILKSEMMLFASMKQEKQLMQASSQLAEAKKLLSRGQAQEASRIVHEVKQLIERINFKPSETKVMHYVSERASNQPPQLPAQLSESIRALGQDQSARGMLEAVRGLGINRDSEMAQQFASGRDGQQQGSQQNLKAALLQLLRGEEEGSRAQQLANQALSNITGQQLLSKSDQQGNLQSLFMNLPFLLEEKVENLQVFVNSRSEGQKVDWENCSLYFLMETKKLGEIGILVQVADRNLSVTLKNDKNDFATKMEPLVELTTTRLSEIGYSISSIKFAKMTSESKEQQGVKANNTAETQQPIFTEKGFDFKI
ncbi:hypothetical protein [Halalkalibacterium ligniniphilum]|uniref:hypothetical protein n=1 Tax=Halalkalibacterium ligniniphilum TaxID=1134413 RepID=UPI00034DB966|nr:hypothetical protein [Halalkalibacterium ligniniphilum]